MSDEFRLTPLDIRKTEFKKGMRGYEAMAVEDFRARVADELEQMVKEKLSLEQRVRALEESLRVFKERERAMNDALIAAQQLRAETKEQAERDAQLILREAEADAERRLERARRELERLETNGQEMARKHHAYLTSLRALVDRQKAELEALAHSEALTFGKVAGSISPQAAAPADAAARKSSPKWIKSIVEE